MGESGAVDISSSSITKETWRYASEEGSSDCDMSKVPSIVEAKYCDDRCRKRRVRTTILLVRTYMLSDAMVTLGDASQHSDQAQQPGTRTRRVTHR